MSTVRLSSLDDRESLLLYLIDLGISRTQIKKSTLQKGLLSRSVRAGDELCLPLDLVNYFVINPHYEGPKIEILYEDNNFLAIDKPHHIDGHPLSYSERRNCLSFLRQEGKFAPLAVASDTHERGMLYRLDQVTSGVLVFAKSAAAFKTLRDNFKTLVKEKVYYVITSALPSAQGEIRLNFSPTGAKGKKMAVSSKGKEGILHLETVAHKEEQYLHKIVLQSGLRHQIRATLAHLGTPVLGDQLYGGNPSERVYLHAYCYVAEYMGKEFTFTSPLPSKWEELLALERLP